MSDKKTKKIGKIVVVTLGVAILFFLLLPFLEEDTVAAKDKSAKKAIPQIFTSNPLSELVRKVYSMFARNRQPEANAQLAYAPANGSNTEVLAAASDSERYDVTHEAAGGSSAGSISFDDFEGAGFINEEGEWVLIEQKAPEMAERGMHEVNTTDKAYDKYVRLERAAKYTGSVQNTALDIPDSKWARLWKPIKKLFGKEEGNTVSPKNTDNSSFALANASSGLGKDRAKRGGKYAKADKPELGGDMKFQLPTLNGQPADVLKMLNPEIALTESAENLKTRAREMLSPDDANDMEKIIDQKHIQMRQQINTELKQLMAIEANKYEKEPIMAYTLSDCHDEPTAFYQTATACTDGGATQQKRTNLAQRIQEITGDPQLSRYFQDNQVKMRIIVDHTQPGENPTQLPQAQLSEYDITLANEFINEPDNEANKSVYRKVFVNEMTNILFELQGCNDHPCIFAATNYDPSQDKTTSPVQTLKNIRENAGVTPVGFDEDEQIIKQAEEKLRKEKPYLFQGDAREKAGYPTVTYVPHDAKILNDDTKDSDQKTNSSPKPPEILNLVSNAHTGLFLYNVIPTDQIGSIILDQKEEDSSPAQDSSHFATTELTTLDFGDEGAGFSQSTPTIKSGGATLDGSKPLSEEARAQNAENSIVNTVTTVYSTTQNILKQGNAELGQQTLQRASFAGEHMDDILGGY